MGPEPASSSCEPRAASGVRRVARKLGISATVLVALVLAVEAGYRANVYGARGFSVQAMNSLRVGGARTTVMASDDPELRYVLRPHVDTTQVFVPFRTNSRGLQDREYDLEPPAGALRVAVLGDSFTAAEGVAHEATFHSVPERDLPVEPGREVEFLNFAVGGYSLTDDAALAERHVAAWSPDLVLVGLCFNDQYPPKDRRAGRFVVPDEVPPFFQLHAWSALTDRPRRVSAGERADPNRWQGEGWDGHKEAHVRARMARIRDACAARGWGLLFVHLRFEPKLHAVRADEVFSAVAAELDVPYLDTFAALPDRPAAGTADPDVAGGGWAARALSTDFPQGSGAPNPYPVPDLQSLAVHAEQSPKIARAPRGARALERGAYTRRARS